MSRPRPHAAGWASLYTAGKSWRWRWVTDAVTGLSKASCTIAQSRCSCQGSVHMESPILRLSNMYEGTNHGRKAHKSNADHSRDAGTEAKQEGRAGRDTPQAGPTRRVAVLRCAVRCTPMHSDVCTPVEMHNSFELLGPGEAYERPARPWTKAIRRHAQVAEAQHRLSVE